MAEVGALDKPDFSEADAERLRGKALRAPLLIVVAARVQEHPKVPEIEQLLSAGCAAMNMLTACHALGYGAIWRTGSLVYKTGNVPGPGTQSGRSSPDRCALHWHAGWKTQTPTWDRHRGLFPILECGSETVERSDSLSSHELSQRIYLPCEHQLFANAPPAVATEFAERADHAVTGDQVGN